MQKAPVQYRCYHSSSSCWSAGTNLNFSNGASQFPQFGDLDFGTPAVSRFPTGFLWHTFLWLSFEWMSYSRGKNVLLNQAMQLKVKITDHGDWLTTAHEVISYSFMYSFLTHYKCYKICWLKSPLFLKPNLSVTRYPHILAPPSLPHYLLHLIGLVSDSFHLALSNLLLSFLPPIRTKSLVQRESQEEGWFDKTVMYF